jgi:hypothetical protein
MVKQAPQYDVDAFDEDPADHRIVYNLRQSSQTDIYPGNSVPLFLSDDDGEPDPSEYVTPLLKKRRSSFSSRILAGVCGAAAAAMLVALFSSDASRNAIVNGKGSMTSVFSALSAAAQSDPSQPTARDIRKDPARSSATENQTPGVRSVTTAAVAPPREEIKIAYQSALQGRTPPAAAAAEPTTPEDAVRHLHHLDPDVIASLLKRADALIASGDVAAARLVLLRAADAGDARAAMTLAGTYDPAVLEKLDVHGVVPNVAMARSWYEKAKKLGSAEAPQRLEMLASKRQ